LIAAAHDRAGVTFTWTAARGIEVDQPGAVRREIAVKAGSATEHPRAVALLLMEVKVVCCRYSIMSSMIHRLTNIGRDSTGWIMTAVGRWPACLAATGITVPAARSAAAQSTAAAAMTDAQGAP
jgi:hypothetical protein